MLTNTSERLSGKTMPSFIFLITFAEISDACLFLASDKSSYITGTTIEVAG